MEHCVVIARQHAVHAFVTASLSNASIPYRSLVLEWRGSHLWRVDVQAALTFREQRANFLDDLV